LKINSNNLSAELVKIYSSHTSSCEKRQKILLNF